jgi:hypothetical protein
VVGGYGGWWWVVMMDGGGWWWWVVVVDGCGWWWVVMCGEDTRFLNIFTFFVFSKKRLFSKYFKKIQALSFHFNITYFDLPRI